MIPVGHSSVRFGASRWASARDRSCGERLRDHGQCVRAQVVQLIGPQAGDHQEEWRVVCQWTAPGKARILGIAAASDPRPHIVDGAIDVLIDPAEPGNWDLAMNLAPRD